MKDKVDISAVICTRNRGDLIVSTLASILANTHPDFEIIVVDQSTNDVTETAVKPFLTNPQVRYIHSPTSGLGKARQIGLMAAQSNTIAYTDDDCTVPPNWLEVLDDIFHTNHRVAVAFCNVVPTEYDRMAGFIPGYERSDEKIVKTMWDKCLARGMGAGLAVRREAILTFGGFDIFLGPGTDFSACEDGDIALRAILKGWWVYETARVAVLHDGFRTWEQGKELNRRNWIGIGAAYSKPIKSGYWQAIIVILYEFLVAIGKPLTKLFQFQKPQGILSAYYFCKGFGQGLKRDVDREDILFVSPASIGSPEEGMYEGAQQ